MLAHDVLEDLIVKELQGLCTTCAHFEDCVYRKTTRKIIIQCEFFEINTVQNPVEQPAKNTSLKGLCSNCSKASHCNLVKGQSGVWHCEEYE